MDKLIFVYNANSGTLNTLFDVGHKLISPSTYKCSLCALTFGTFSENKAWKNFREQSDIKMEFYHSDEFENKFPNQKFDYPVILKQLETGLEVFLDKKTLNVIDSVADLINEISDKKLKTKH